MCSWAPTISWPNGSFGTTATFSRVQESVRSLTLFTQPLSHLPKGRPTIENHARIYGEWAKRQSLERFSWTGFRGDYDGDTISKVLECSYISLQALHLSPGGSPIRNANDPQQLPSFRSHATWQLPALTRLSLSYCQIGESLGKSIDPAKMRSLTLWRCEGSTVWLRNLTAHGAPQFRFLYLAPRRARASDPAAERSKTAREMSDIASVLHHCHDIEQLYLNLEDLRPQKLSLATLSHMKPCLRRLGLWYEERYSSESPNRLDWATLVKLDLDCLSVSGSLHDFVRIFQCKTICADSGIEARS